jgi:coenzyme F420-reducing hydrogenase delta subunit/Fe-S-cluster-containing hydrogenase component 2
MRLVRVMCSGRVDPRFVLRAFSKGVDGVFVGGCRLNECNYTTHGNYHALNMVLLMKRVLEHIGLNSNRLKIEFMSSAEGNRFAETVNGFVRQVKELGPLGKAEGLNPATLQSRLEEVTRLVPYLKRVNKDKLASRLTHPDAYDSLFTREEVQALFRDVVSYYIDPEKCQACMICAKRCPEEAIIGGKNLIHVIDQARCIKCETCFDVCPSRFGAVTKISGAPVPPPLAEEKRSIVRKSKEK